MRREREGGLPHELTTREILQKFPWLQKPQHHESEEREGFPHHLGDVGYVELVRKDRELESITMVPWDIEILEKIPTQDTQDIQTGSIELSGEDIIAVTQSGVVVTEARPETITLSFDDYDGPAYQPEGISDSIMSRWRQETRESIRRGKAHPMDADLTSAAYIIRRSNDRKIQKLEIMEVNKKDLLNKLLAEKAKIDLEEDNNLPQA